MILGSKEDRKARLTQAVDHILAERNVLGRHIMTASPSTPFGMRLLRADDAKSCQGRIFWLSVDAGSAGGGGGRGSVAHRGLLCPQWSRGRAWRRVRSA